MEAQQYAVELESIRKGLEDKEHTFLGQAGSRIGIIMKIQL